MNFSYILLDIVIAEKKLENVFALFLRNLASKRPGEGCFKAGPISLSFIDRFQFFLSQNAW